MKRIIKTFVFAAVAAAAFTACNKEIEITTPVDEEVYVYTFALGDATPTKAILGSDETGRFVQWTTGDQLGSITTKSQGYSNITPASGETPAQFQIYSSGGLTAGNTINVWFPYGTKQTNATAVPLEIPATQKQRDADGLFDFKNMPMVAKEITVTSEMETASNGTNPTPLATINMANLGSVINFKVFSTNATYATEKVKSITFNGRNADNTADANIGGIFEKNLTTVDPDNEETMTISSFTTGYTSITTSPLSSSAIGANKGTALDLYMVVAPGQYRGTIVVNTDAAEYTFTLSDAKTFVRSGIKAFGLDLGSGNANRVENAPLVKGSMWSYTFTDSPFSSGTASLTYGTKTLEWSASVNPSGYTNDALSFGTNSSPAAATISTSDYTDGVSSVKIAIKGNSKKNVTAAVTVDGTNLKCEGNNTVTQSGNTLTEYEFVSADLLAGTISIIFTDPSGGYQIKSIVINEKVKTSQTISFAEDEVEWIIGTDCTLNTAKLGLTVSGAQTTVSYTSSDTSVAEIDNNGVVTPKKAGTVIITATAEEDDDYTSANDSYALTITDPDATEDPKTYTVTFTSSTEPNNSSYTGSYTVTIGTDTWTVAGFNNNNNGWSGLIKGGRKDNTSAGSIASDFAMPFTISTVKVTYGSFVDGKISSAKLISATDADFTKNVVEKDITATASSTQTYTIDSPAKDRYFKLAFEFASCSKNGDAVSISQIQYSNN